MTDNLVKISQFNINKQIVKYHFIKDGEQLYAIEVDGYRYKLDFHESKILQIDKISDELIYKTIISDEDIIISTNYIKIFKNNVWEKKVMPKITKFDGKIQTYDLNYIPGEIEIDCDYAYISDRRSLDETSSHDCSNINIHKLENMHKLYTINIFNNMPITNMIILGNYSRILVTSSNIIRLLDFVNFKVILSIKCINGTVHATKRNKSRFILKYNKYLDTSSIVAQFSMKGNHIREINTRTFHNNYIIMPSVNKIFFNSSHGDNCNSVRIINTDNNVESEDNFNGSKLTKINDDIIIAEKLSEVQVWTTESYAAKLRVLAFLLGTISNTSPINQSYKSNWLYESKLNKLICEYLP